MSASNHNGRDDRIVPFPHARTRREAAQAEARGPAAEVVDLSWQQMMRDLGEEMELGLVLQGSYDPWRVNRFIERRRARNARREAKCMARLAADNPAKE